MSRYVLGVYSGHDAAACLFRDNKLLYAIEKERLSRIKHDEGEPIECIEYIMKAADISYSDIDLVVRCNWFDIFWSGLFCSASFDNPRDSICCLLFRYRKS